MDESGLVSCLYWPHEDGFVLSGVGLVCVGLFHQREYSVPFCFPQSLGCRGSNICQLQKLQHKQTVSGLDRVQYLAGRQGFVKLVSHTPTRSLKNVMASDLIHCSAGGAPHFARSFLFSLNCLKPLS